MSKLLATLMVFLLVAAPAVLEAAWARSSQANAPRIDRQETNAPRGGDSGAPRSLEISAPDRPDQGSPAP